MIDGTIELIGPDQVLPAQQYQHIRLSGTGTKTTRGGNLTITGNLTIATPVTLNITKGNVISLGDTLFEFGKLKGAIQKYVDLSGRRLLHQILEILEPLLIGHLKLRELQMYSAYLMQFRLGMETSPSNGITTFNQTMQQQ